MLRILTTALTALIVTGSASAHHFGQAACERNPKHPHCQSGGGVPGDTQAPTTPTNLRQTGATETSASVAWDAASDNVAVAGYDAYRGGNRVGTTTSTSFAFTGLSCATSYTVGADAYDAAGNRSQQATFVVSTSPCPSGTSEPAPIAGQGYRLAFADEFASFDRNVWMNRIWYGADPPAGAIASANGVLNLVSRRADGYPNVTTTTLNAGGGTKSFLRGYFEARMRWTGGNGSWPAFWLFSQRHSTNPAYPSLNPFCSQNGLANALCYSAEIDVMEGQGSEPSVFYGTHHRNSCSCYGVSNQMNSNNYQPQGFRLADAWQVYSVLWTTTHLHWYVNGVLTHSSPVFDSTNQPLYLLLQMWTGGWTRGVDSTTPSELRTEVDWVRVWQR